MVIIDKKSIIANRIFYSVIFLLIISSVIVTYVKIVVLNDYQIIAEVSCDPTIEKCFVWECDPDDDSTCSEKPNEQVSYYKIISKKALNIASCEATTEKNGCGEELSCLSGETSCSYKYCDPNNHLADEKCSK